MIYLDTNVIIYSIENHPKYGKACAKILQDIENEKIEACASMLVLVETINVLTKLNKVLKEKGEKPLNIRKNIDALLSLPVVWMDLNFPTLRRAAEYSYSVSGVDYIHIATMEINNIKEIVSADDELDKVDVIKRTDPLLY